MTRTALIDAATDRRANRAPWLWAGALAAMCAAPVVAFLAVDRIVALGCNVAHIDGGPVDGAIEWRLDRVACAAGTYFDLSLGARGKHLSPALITRGAPLPVAVERTGETGVLVRFAAPLADGRETVSIRLRRSGSPAERIDLQAGAGGRP